MCGIVGYAGRRECMELLLRGLEDLEYRGYDSAGIALSLATGIERVRCRGALRSLRAEIARRAGDGSWPVAADTATAGIGHTRWATHGSVTEQNAHPHTDPTGRIHIVLNGVVENFVELRREIGIDRFSSETDAEVVAHLVAHYHETDLGSAVRRAAARLRGHFAFVAVAADQPGVLVATRRECPLVIGVGDGEHMVASSANVIAPHGHLLVTLDDGDIATVTADDLLIEDINGQRVVRTPELPRDRDARVDLGGYATFMRKEIFEQPAAVVATLKNRLDGGHLHLPELAGALVGAGDLRRIVIVGCGTSYHAGLAGRYAIEQWTGLPTDVEVASEYCYHAPRLGSRSLVIAITQSGETADTLAAVRLARAQGAPVIAITNVADSQITREVDAALLTAAGLEVSVAATKSYLTQLIALYLVALALGEAREAVPADEITRLGKEIEALPGLLHLVLSTADEPAARFADDWGEAEFFLYLGRHVGLPVAMEGALKLKEVSYIPAEAYPGGEMKHGPIALLDRRTPVIAIATESPARAKLVTNLAEVKAREATVLAIATEGSEPPPDVVDEVIVLPRCDWLLQPVLAAVPLQLLALRVAEARGLDVDRPRNLAKTVTVE